MTRCSNCGTTVPLGKSLSGRGLDKDSRRCPDCDEPVESSRSGRRLRK